jgi:hypothetical protein
VPRPRAGDQHRRAVAAQARKRALAGRRERRLAVDEAHVAEDHRDARRVLVAEPVTARQLGGREDNPHARRFVDPPELRARRQQVAAARKASREFGGEERQVGLAHWRRRGDGLGECRRQVDRDRPRVAGVCVEIPGRDHRQHDIYARALDRETVASLVVATPGDMGHARRAGRERW